MTDFRALCAELLDHYDLEWRAREKISAALTQPEPQGPTDEGLADTYWKAWHEHLDRTNTVLHAAGLRAVLARWGRPAIEPVPVAERLPGPGDCDEEGRCWFHSTGLGFQKWHFLDRYPSAESYTFYGYTHWLPHHALPVPQQEAE